MEQMNLTNLEPEDLDDFIHQVASEQVANVNNGGMEEQLEWLRMQGITDEEILDNASRHLGHWLVTGRREDREPFQWYLRAYDAEHAGLEFVRCARHKAPDDGEVGRETYVDLVAELNGPPRGIEQAIQDELGVGIGPTAAESVISPTARKRQMAVRYQMAEGQPELGRMLFLTTAHLSREVAQAMDRMGHDPETGSMVNVTYEVDGKAAACTSWAHPIDSGYLVWVPPWDEPADEELAPYPACVAAAIRLAWELGCRYIRYDCDADQAQALTGQGHFYDW